MYTYFVCLGCAERVWLPVALESSTAPCPTCSNRLLVSYVALARKARKDWQARHPEPRTAPEQKRTRHPEQKPALALLSSKP